MNEPSSFSASMNTPTNIDTTSPFNQNPFLMNSMFIIHTLLHSTCVTRLFIYSIYIYIFQI